MVKGFDTTTSDPSKLLLDSIFGLWDSHRIKMTPEIANAYLLQWLGSGTLTSQIYRKFEYISSRPRIVLHQQCPKPVLFANMPYEGDVNFGAYEHQSSIHVCLNSIRNKIELKQNIDRELTSLYYKLTRKESAHGEQDKTLIQNLYESCQQGYRNYSWEESTVKRVAKKCAVYLFRRRTQSNLPPDSLFRYSSKIADQFCL